MKRLSRMGQVVEVAHDHFFRTPVVAEMLAIAGKLSAADADGSFSAAAFRDMVVTRKEPVPHQEILEVTAIVHAGAKSLKEKSRLVSLSEVMA